MEKTNMIDELVELTSEKKELLNYILDITKRQNKFIELGKLKTVKKLDALKNDYMTKADKLYERFFILYNELEAKLNMDSFNEVAGEKGLKLNELKSNVSEILKIVKDIKLIENQNISKLKIDKDSNVAKLLGIKQRKRINNVYGSDRYNKMVGSVLFDKKF